VRFIEFENSGAIPFRVIIAMANVPRFVSVRALFESIQGIVNFTFGMIGGSLDKVSPWRR
jgi:hypothetical protein